MANNESSSEINPSAVKFDVCPGNRGQDGGYLSPRKWVLTPLFVEGREGDLQG